MIPTAEELTQHEQEHDLIDLDEHIEDIAKKVTKEKVDEIPHFLGGGGGGGGSGSGVSEETDPIFTASEAFGFAAGDVAKLAGIAAGADVTANATIDGGTY